MSNIKKEYFWIARGYKSQKIYAKSKIRSEVFKNLQEKYPSCRDEWVERNNNLKLVRSAIRPIYPEEIRVKKELIVYE